MMNTELDEIATCPWKGQHERKDLRSPRVITGSSPGINLFQVYCPCGAKGPHAGTKEEAIDNWNIRRNNPEK